MKDNKNKLTEEEKREILKTGIVAGSTLGTLGTGIAVSAHALDKAIKAGKDNKYTRGVRMQAGRSGQNSVKMLSRLKKGGAAMAAIGIPTAGVSAYKHYKNKKKDANTEK